jgi:N-methylhydantoinase A
MKLDYEGSRRVLEKEIAKPLNMTVEEASHSILLVQSANIESGIRAVSLERGYDPREFTLISFGGASALLMGMVAEQLSIPKVLIPQQASVFSAFGLLMADIRRTRSLTRILPATAANLKEVENIYEQLENEIKEALVLEGGSIEQAIIHKSCDMRYVGQAYEINVPFPEYSRPMDAQTMKKLCASFHLHHRKRFGHSAEEEPIELVCFRVLGILPVRGTKFLPKKEMRGSPLKGHRRAYFGKEKGFMECPIYDREYMNKDYQVEGPAIIEDPITTIVIYPGHRAEVDSMGNNHLSLKH